MKEIIIIILITLFLISIVTWIITACIRIYITNVIMGEFNRIRNMPNIEDSVSITDILSFLLQ